MEKYKILQQYMAGNMHRFSTIEPTEFGLGVNPENSAGYTENQRIMEKSKTAYNAGKQNAQTKIKNI